MEVAISSLLFKSHPLGEVIDLARDQGVSWLEVWTEHFWRDDHGDLIKRLRQCGFKLSVHGPIGDLNITSSNQGIREESIRQVIQGGGNMPAYGKNLSPAETTALVAFLRTLHPAGQPPARDAARDLMRGARAERP